MKKLSAAEQKIYDMIFGDLTEGVTGKEAYKALVDARIQSLPIHMAIAAYKEHVSGISRFTSQMHNLIYGECVPTELRAKVTEAVFGHERPVITIAEGGLMKQLATVHPRFIHVPIMHKDQMQTFDNLTVLSCDYCFDSFAKACEQIKENGEYIRAAIDRKDEKGLERVLMRDIPYKEAGLTEKEWTRVVGNMLKSLIPAKILYATTPEDYTLMYEGPKPGRGIASCMSFTHERPWGKLYPQHHPAHFYAHSPNIKGAYIMTVDEQYIRARAILFRENALGKWHCGRIYTRDAGGFTAFSNGLQADGVVINHGGGRGYSFPNPIEPFDIPIHEHPAIDRKFTMVPYFDSFGNVYGVTKEKVVTVYINPSKVPQGGAGIAVGGDGMLYVTAAAGHLCHACGRATPADVTRALGNGRYICNERCANALAYTFARRADGSIRTVPTDQAVFCPLTGRAYTTEDALARAGAFPLLRFLSPDLDEVEETEDLAVGVAIVVGAQVYSVSRDDYHRLLKKTGGTLGTKSFKVQEVFDNHIKITHERADPIVLDNPITYAID